MLVVEDDATTSDLLGYIFSHMGWEVTQAATVADALDRLDPPPEVLILDLSLPDGDGIEVLRRVREGHLPTRVAVTTGHDLTSLGSLADLHPDAVLQKPIEINDVCRACRA